MENELNTTKYFEKIKILYSWIFVLYFKWHRFSILYLYVFLFPLLFNPLSAEPILLTEEIQSYALGPELELYEDKNAILELQDFLSPVSGISFRKNEKSIPSFGYTRSAIWGRFSINAKNRQGESWYLEFASAPTYNFQLFEKLPDGQWKQTDAGSMKPFGERPVHFRTFLFPLKLNGIHHYYFRIETGGSSSIPLVLWNREAFLERAANEQLFFGLFFGIVLVMVLYNGFLFFTIKDANYIYYLLYITHFGLAMFSDKGLALQYFWPNHPEFNAVIELYFYNSAVIWALIFIRKFLENGSSAGSINRWIDRIFISLMFLATPVLPIYFLLDTQISFKYNMTISLISSIFVLFASTYNFFQGKKSARFFLLAFLGMLLGIPIYGLQLSGYIPSNLWTENTILVTSVLEVTFLSLALADRINILRSEKENALLKTSEISKKLSQLQIDRIKRLINPHYILNSLHAIAGWMEKNPNRADEAIEALSDEFRRALDYTEKESISLKEEIDLCSSYLKSMSIRKMTPYMLETEAPDMTLQIPPMILHTILENGIKHENPEAKPAHFLIKQIKTGNKNRITVICKGDFRISSKEHEGLGTAYIKTRLTERFGSDWSFAQKAAEDGWKIEIELGNVKSKDS